MTDWVHHVSEAKERLRDVPITPLLECEALSERLGVPAFLKAESLQRTGSFKYRPALNGIRALDDAARSRGVIASSSGNFAAAVARAARDEGVRATIVMTPSTAPHKVERTRAYGAEIVICEDRYEARQETVDCLKAESGAAELHPHSSLETVAGDTTIGFELLTQNPAISTIVAPASGGGLLGGCALAAFLSGSDTRVFCAQPNGNPAMVRSIETGVRCRTEKVETIADGLQAATPGSFGFDIAREHVHGAAAVSDESIIAAMQFCYEHARLVVEPAGATALAAMLDGAIEPHGPVAVILSGGNVDRHAFARWMEVPISR